MARFEQAEKRLFKNKFVCRACKATLRAPNMLIIKGKVLCRRCRGKALRPVRRK